MDFVLNTKSGVPFYRQIIDQITFAIANHKVRAGDQLPTVRALAAELQINLNTVSKAYTELEIKGVLTTQQGTGTFVSDKKIKVGRAEKQKKTKELCEEFIRIGAAYGFTREELAASLQRQSRKDHDNQRY